LRHAKGRVFGMCADETRHPAIRQEGEAMIRHVSRRSALACAVSFAAAASVGACGGGATVGDVRLGPQAVAGQTPDGTVEMREVQVAYIGSGGGGSGVLHYRGRAYPFTVAGLGVGGIGASTIEAQGEVYNLPDPSRFPGTYGQARYGFAVGTASGGEMWLQNEAGAIMRLRARREGLMLSLGGDAMLISMR
jgi:hypothetical protein